MNKKPISTFEQEMKISSFKNQFDKGYTKFLFSELLTAIMDGDDQSVRELAKEVGVSPTIIQRIRSGKQTDVKLSNFINLINAFGYKVVLEKNNERIEIKEEVLKSKHNITFLQIR